jgi:hypothetical protein
VGGQYILNTMAAKSQAGKLKNFISEASTRNDPTHRDRHIPLPDFVLNR